MFLLKILMFLNTPLKQKFPVLVKVHNPKILVKTMGSEVLQMGCFCLVIDVPNANANAPNVVHTFDN